MLSFAMLFSYYLKACRLPWVMHEPKPPGGQRGLFHRMTANSVNLSLIYEDGGDLPVEDGEENKTAILSTAVKMVLLPNGNATCVKQ